MSINLREPVYSETLLSREIAYKLTLVYISERLRLFGTRLYDLDYTRHVNLIGRFL